MPQVEQAVSEEVLDHLIGAIEQTEVCHSPYDHFYLEKVFPDAIYEQIQENLPRPDEYWADNPKIHTRDDGMVTRNIRSLSPAGLESLPEPRRSFWLGVSAALMSSRLKDAVFRALSRDLCRRFGGTPDGLLSIGAYPKPALVKDLGGYEIRPHTDTRSKIVTMQFYLPDDNSKKDLGTAVYRMRLLKLSNLVSPKNRFEKVKQFSFSPNSGYAFAVGNRSWHGRETVPMASGERNSLMLIYYTTPDKGW